MERDKHRLVFSYEAFKLKWQVSLEKNTMSSWHVLVDDLLDRFSGFLFCVALIVGARITFFSLTFVSVSFLLSVS